MRIATIGALNRRLIVDVHPARGEAIDLDFDALPEEPRRAALSPLRRVAQDHCVHGDQSAVVHEINSARPVVTLRVFLFISIEYQ